VREAADFSQRFDASCACSGRSTACCCGGRRKDHIDRRLGGRNVDSNGSCEHVPHTSNAIGVTSMLAAGYILAISLSARSTGKHDPNCANDADMPRGKAKRMMTDTPSTDQRSCSRHLTRRSRTRRRLRYRFFDANDVNGWACSPPHVAGGRLRPASVPD
jgi:hypothetical protein